jgi:hypothetical protein
MQWQIAAATASFPGVRIVAYTKSAADCYLKQDLIGEIIKGRTYRIMMKVQALTANPSGDVLSVIVRQKLSPFKVIESGMDWRPTITTTAGWHERTFTADYSSDTLELLIYARGLSGSWGSCTGIRIDEVYVYEDIPVNRLVVLDHNWCNGEITALYGWRCNPDRTNAGSGDRSPNLLATQDVDQTEPIIKATTESNYPVWQLTLTATTGLTYEAGVIFLGPHMAFTKQMDAPFDPDAEEVEGIMNETAAGRRTFHKLFSRGGPYELAFTNVNSTFYDLLKDWWDEVGRDRVPFFFCFDESNIPTEIKFVRNESNFLFAYDPVFRGGRILLREEL